uniref:Uncharacterized protein n=1 Tax=Homalodisca liturata TaxID=320908 RepID=A0A1B6HG03_9HEMI
MGDPLRQSEIDRIIDLPSSQGDLFAGLSEDESVEDMDYSVVDDTDSDPDFQPSDGSDEAAENEFMVANEDTDADVDNTITTVNSTPDEGDNWHSFEGKQQIFEFNSRPTFKFITTNDSKPIDFFEQCLNADVIDLMVTETNRNAHDVISKLRLSRKSRLKDWRDTNPEEMKKFIGLLLYMGLVTLPRISDYWSTNALYSFSGASKVMSRNRFQLILRFWHFNDNNNLQRDGRIGKIKPLLSIINGMFFNLKEAEQDLVIDETMIPFRGRLLFRQYIPGKAHKYGIKIFKLCDKTGYTYGIKVYMGKGTVAATDNSVATSVVMELMANHLNSGHNLYVDNYYTSVQLANSLLSRQTHLCGTLRRNRKGIPKDLTKEKIQKGEMICLENDEGVLITKWQDKREVLMLSTVHKPEYVEIPSKNPDKPSVLKPLVVTAYNKAKVGIDLSDQMSSYSTAVRKTMRWYHKVGEELVLGTSVVNSWLAYNTFLKTKKPPNAKKKHLISITKFKEQLACSLMCLQETPRIPEVSRTGHHYLTSSAMVGEGAKKHRVRKVCKMCYQKLSEQRGRSVARNMTKVTTFCSVCPDKPFLCETCFKDIHK